MLGGVGEGDVLFCIQLKAQDLDLLLVYSIIHFWRVNSSLLPQSKLLPSPPLVTRNWGLWVIVIFAALSDDTEYYK